MCCFHLNSLKAARKYSNLHRFTCNCKAKAPKLWSNQSFCGKVKGRIKTICFVVKLKAIQKIVQYSLCPQSPKVPNQPDLSCKTLRKLQQMAFLDTYLHFIDRCWNSGPTGEIFAKQLNPNHPFYLPRCRHWTKLSWSITAAKYVKNLYDLISASTLKGWEKFHNLTSLALFCYFGQRFCFVEVIYFFQIISRSLLALLTL